MGIPPMQVHLPGRGTVILPMLIHPQNPDLKSEIRNLKSTQRYMKF
jgi:hypothetical protein